MSRKSLLNSYFIHFGGRLFITTAWSNRFFFVALQIFKPPLIVGNLEIKMYSLTLSLLAEDIFLVHCKNGKEIQKHSQGPYSTFSLWLKFVRNTLTNIYSDIFSNIFMFREEVKLVLRILLPGKISPSFYFPPLLHPPSSALSVWSSCLCCLGMWIGRNGRAEATFTRSGSLRLGCAVQPHQNQVV